MRRGQKSPGARKVYFPLPERSIGGFDFLPTGQAGAQPQKKASK